VLKCGFFKVKVKNTIWDYPEPFEMEVYAQESDIDGYHHVNNSVYLRWMDECAREHSKALGIDTANASEFQIVILVDGVTLTGAALN